MDYTLVKPDGTKMQFHLLAIAELYQGFHGGVVLYKGKAILKLAA